MTPEPVTEPQDAAVMSKMADAQSGSSQLSWLTPAAGQEADALEGVATFWGLATQCDVRMELLNTEQTSQCHSDSLL